VTGPLLEFRAADVGYGELRVVRNVTLEVRPGEVVALVGPNGSGKSTLVKGLLGLAQLQRGEVRLFGEPATALTERSRIGYVPQREAVTGTVPVSVAELVATGWLPRGRWWLPRLGGDGRAAVTAAISAVGLADRSRHRVATLSGGQQRRASIARALVGSPQVLVMDEPLAGVDADSQQALADTLAALAADGVTQIIVLHELGPLDPIITRVVALEHGRVVYDGPHTAESHATYAAHQHAHPDAVADEGAWGLT
jgi:zinc transport system ATP-binding protein